MQQKKEIVKPNILIELDALLDTTAGTVRMLYPDLVDDLLNNKGYRKRIDDNLSDIDPRIDALTFSNAYSKRDINTLDYSFSSLMIGYTKKLLGDIEHVILGNNPVIRAANVHINLYPYQMDENRAELIVLAISTALGLREKAKAVYLEPKEINPDFIKQSGISTYILYNFNTWVTSALPDVSGPDLQSVGLERLENFVVIAPKLAVDKAKEQETRDEFAKYGMLDAFDYLSVLPWNLLFELQLLDPVFYTEFSPEQAEKIMSLVEKSSSPIDIEISMISEFYHILGLTSTKVGNIEAISDQLVECAERIREIRTNPDRLDDLRILLAEQRFLTDSLSFFLPSQPSLDFERYIDSRMSDFDISMENSEMSEEKWNSLGVKCRRLVRNVSSIGKDAYLLVCAEDCIDVNGVLRKKNHLLRSVFAFPPVLEPMPETEIKQFIEEINE